MELKTEYEFILPRGYVDAEGNLHKEGVMRLAIDDEVIDEAIVEFDGIWSDINDAADAGLFPCQTSVLCNWCDAQTTTCPAWQDEDGQPVDLNSRL